MQIKLKDKESQNPKEQDTVLTAVMWLLTSFMLISGLIFIPSWASVTMILFSVISAPIEQLQEFYASKKLKGGIKVALLIALFGLSIALY